MNFFFKRNFKSLPQKGQAFGNFLIICQAIIVGVCSSPSEKYVTDQDVCVSKIFLKKGEIVEEAVKEELTKLCANLYNFSLSPLWPCRFEKNKVWFTPERRWLRFLDDRNDPKSLLEHFNCPKRSPSMWNNDEMLKRLSCGEHFYAAVSQKRTTTLFLSLDWVIVSSFSISQNHVNSVFWGSLGKIDGGENCSESNSPIPLVPEAFHARFPVSVKSLKVAREKSLWTRAPSLW